MNKAFKYQIYPNATQRILIERTFGCVRFTYNRMLADKIAYYEQTKQKLNNIPTQYKTEFSWLCEVNKFALGNAQMQLQRAYKNFFRAKGKVGFPKFKSKHRDKWTYTTMEIMPGQCS